MISFCGKEINRCNITVKQERLQRCLTDFLLLLLLVLLMMLCDCILDLVQRSSVQSQKPSRRRLGGQAKDAAWWYILVQVNVHKHCFLQIGDGQK